MPTNSQMEALKYIYNAGGNATVKTLATDFEPIGYRMWRDIKDTDWVQEWEDGSLHLTASGIRLVLAA